MEYTAECKKCHYSETRSAYPDSLSKTYLYTVVSFFYLFLCVGIFKKELLPLIMLPYIFHRLVEVRLSFYAAAIPTSCPKCDANPPDEFVGTSKKILTIRGGSNEFFLFHFSLVFIASTIVYGNPSFLYFAMIMPIFEWISISTRERLHR